MMHHISKAIFLETPLPKKWTKYEWIELLTSIAYIFRLFLDVLHESAELEEEVSLGKMYVIFPGGGRLSEVVYISSSFWLLALGLRDLSQSKK